MKFMKTFVKTAVVAAILAAFLLWCRKGLDDTWSIDRVAWGENGPQVRAFAKLTGVRFEVVTTTDLGVMKMAMVRVYRPVIGPEKVVWFFQLPYHLWQVR